jgi:uncharacterized protein (DUF488 family)
MPVIYTIGHSTRPIDEFIELLETAHIEQLIDIRSIPKSLYNPQYVQDTLAAHLRAHSIEYVYLKELGGLRSGKKGDSINGAWRNRSFRNYADYMQTEAFADGIEHLIELGTQKITAIMCAEAVPWRCHRSLVGDALLVRNSTVFDILSKTSIKEHTLTPFAVVDGTKVTYPPKETS